MGLFRGAEERVGRRRWRRVTEERKGEGKGLREAIVMIRRANPSKEKSIDGQFNAIAKKTTRFSHLPTMTHTHTHSEQ